MANEFGNGKSLAPRFPLRLLLVEDNSDDAELCLRLLRKAQFDMEADIVKTPEEFAERLRTTNYDVVLADYNLGNWTGMDALGLLQKNRQDVPLILVTGALGDQRAVECVKQGVADYVLKDRMERLPVAIYQAMEEKSLRNGRRQAERLLAESEANYRILAEVMPVAVFVQQNSHCCYVNRAAEHITGYSHMELLGMDFCQLIQSKMALSQHLAKCLEGSQSTCCDEAPILTKKGEERWLDVTVRTFQMKGKVAALIAGLDITDRKTAAKSGFREF
jgi:PAS domain S-box-containing protein